MSQTWDNAKARQNANARLSPALPPWAIQTAFAKAWTPVAGAFPDPFAGAQTGAFDFTVVKNSG